MILHHEMKVPTTSSDEYEEDTWEACVVTAEVLVDPGQYFGPPEDCYPGESSCSILSIVLHNGSVLNRRELPEDVLNAIEDEMYSRYEEEKYEFYNSYDEYADPS